MASRWDRILAELREEEAELKERKEELRSQMKSVEADIKRIQSALSALGDKPSGKTSERKTRSKKLMTTREQVSELIAEVLQEKGALEGPALKEEVEARLNRRGLSRVGFVACFQEALRDERFVESPAGWKLAGGEEADVDGEISAEVAAAQH
jgi:hypothetical protein